MRALITIIAMLFFINVKSQLIDFISVYGNGGYDYGRDIKECHDSTFIVTGSSSSFVTAEADAYLLKVNKYGDFLWSYNYGGPDSDWGQSVVITYDSSYAIGGYTNSSGAGGFDFYLIRAASDGTPLWEKTYGGSDWDQAFDLIEMPDSGFVLVGYTYSFSGTKDGYMVRTNKSGDTLWTKVISGDEEDYLNAIVIDGDSIVVCGGTSSFGSGGFDGMICKMDFDGNIGWTKYVGGINDDYFTSIDSYSTYYLLGGIRGYDYLNAGEDMWYYKLHESGNTVLFDATYDSFCFDDDGTNDVGIIQGTGDMVYTGYTKSWGFLADAKPDYCMGKNNSTGNSIAYLKSYGEAGDDIGHALDICMDYGIVFVGDTKYYSTGGNNIMIVKVTYLWNYPDQFTDLTYHDITTGTDEIPEPLMLNVYPNPAQQSLSVEIPETIEAVTIYSMDGKLISNSVSDNSTISVSELDAGTYVLQVRTASGVSSVVFIKD